MLWLNTTSTSRLTFLHRVQPPIYLLPIDHIPIDYLDFRRDTCHIRYVKHFIMTITNDEDDAERQAFLPRDTSIEEKSPSNTDSSRSKYYWHYIRLALEIFMALVILILSIRIFHDKNDKDDGKSNLSPVPDCMLTYLDNWLGLLTRDKFH